MSENYTVGSVVKGKVTGVQPYGAFVALDESTQGLVHISEVAHGYVKDINSHLSVGDEVEVKILSVDEKAGKIGLSIKATQEAPAEEKAPKKRAERKPNQAQKQQEADSPAGFNTLKDKLEDWIKQSADREKLLKK